MSSSLPHRPVTDAAADAQQLQYESEKIARGHADAREGRSMDLETFEAWIARLDETGSPPPFKRTPR